MVPYGPVFSRMVPYGPVGSCMVLYGPIWSHRVLYGPKLLHPMIIMKVEIMGSMRPLFLAMLTVLYGPVRPCMDGPVWSSMVYCPVWSLMVP